MVKGKDLFITNSQLIQFLSKDLCNGALKPSCYLGLSFGANINSVTKSALHHLPKTSCHFPTLLLKLIHLFITS